MHACPVTTNSHQELQDQGPLQPRQPSARGFRVVLHTSLVAPAATLRHPGCRNPSAFNLATNAFEKCGTNRTYTCRLDNAPTLHYCLYLQHGKHRYVPVVFMARQGSSIDWCLITRLQITVDDVELIDDSETLNLEDYELVEIDEDARPSDDSGKNVHMTCAVLVSSVPKCPIRSSRRRCRV